MSEAADGETALKVVEIVLVLAHERGVEKVLVLAHERGVEKVLVLAHERAAEKVLTLVHKRVAEVVHEMAVADDLLQLEEELK